MFLYDLPLDEDSQIYLLDVNSMVCGYVLFDIFSVKNSLSQYAINNTLFYII